MVLLWHQQYRLDIHSSNLPINLNGIEEQAGVSNKNCGLALYGLHKNKLTKMEKNNNQDDRIAKMTFSSVYPHYLTKVEKKGRTKEELHQVIEWLTGYNNKEIQELIDKDLNFDSFFRGATLNPNVHMITGVICGYRVEEIENPLTRQVRYLDKLVDELAKGRKMEKILRSSSITDR